jgi:hypothetical protein
VKYFAHLTKNAGMVPRGVEPEGDVSKLERVREDASKAESRSKSARGIRELQYRLGLLVGATQATGRRI